METIRTLVGDSWDSLSGKARAAITEADFKTRTSGFLKSVKPRALAALNTGLPLNLKEFCTDEADRLLDKKKISPDELVHIRDYFLEQVTGTVSFKKDADGLRLYLRSSERTYVARNNAPEEAWTKYGRELADDRTGSHGRLLKWAEMHRNIFGSLPVELRDAVDAGLSKAEEDASHAGQRTVSTDEA